VGHVKERLSFLFPSIDIPQSLWLHKGWDRIPINRFENFPVEARFFSVTMTTSPTTTIVNINQEEDDNLMLLKPILVHSSSDEGSYQQGRRRQRHQQGNSRRHVHFERLNWIVEEEKARRGQMLRKHQRMLMRYSRQLRWQEYMDRQRAFDIFSSSDVQIKMQLEDLLNEDSHSSTNTQPQLFSECLHDLLRGLPGAPPGLDLPSMLDWFRHSGIEYSKKNCFDHDVCADYLLFLSRTELFHKYFGQQPSQLNSNVENNNNGSHHPVEWSNPFLAASTAALPSSGSFLLAEESYPPDAIDFENVFPPDTSMETFHQEEQEQEEQQQHSRCYNSSHRHSVTTTTKRLFQHALHFLWKTFRMEKLRRLRQRRHQKQGRRDPFLQDYHHHPSDQCPNVRSSSSSSSSSSSEDSIEVIDRIDDETPPIARTTITSASTRNLVSSTSVDLITRPPLSLSIPFGEMMEEEENDDPLVDLWNCSWLTEGCTISMSSNTTTTNACGAFRLHVV